MAANGTPSAEVENLDFQGLLRHVLDLKGWSQSDLARACGIRIGTINTWFTGTRSKPSGANLRKLAAVTPYTIDVWANAVGRKIPAPLDEDKEQYILGLWRRLSPEEQRFVTMAMEAAAKNPGVAQD